MASIGTFAATDVAKQLGIGRAPNLDLHALVIVALSPQICSSSSRARGHVEPVRP